MLHLRFDIFCVFHIAVLALMLSYRGQSEVIGPIQPVVATVGDDIILSCYLHPAKDASDMTVEWTRPDLKPRLVHVWPERPELQNPSYKNRTSLFINEMKDGNISLKISRVKLFDEGMYRCFVPDQRKDSTVQLVVGVASSSAISLAGLDKAMRGVVLQCESAGWYPEPELLWLDGEGNLLSAGPTETLRGPDDLYTVSSRVTVEKRHSNNITCRVQQRNTNQSRETHIHVLDDFFMVISPPSNLSSNSNIIGLVIGALLVLILILTVFFVVWKKRQAKCKNKKSEEEGVETGIDGESEPLMTRREEENDVASKEEQRHEDERETKKDEFVSETEQMKDIKSPQNSRINPSTVIGKESLNIIEQERHEVTERDEEDDVEDRETQQDDHEAETKQRKDIDSPQEKRINPSTVNDKQSLIKIEQETQDMTGREEEGDVDNSGEKKIQKKMITKKNKKKKKQSKEVDTDSSGTKTCTVTETDPQFEMKQETRGEEEMTGRRMTAEGAESEREKKMETDKDCIELCLLPLREKLKESIVLVNEGKTFKLSSFTELIEEIKSLNSHLSTDQEPWRENETQEKLVEKRQERNVDMKNSDTEKQRAEENSDEVNLNSEVTAQKETQREKLEAEQQREENQRLQSETRSEREKDETELKIRKDNKNQHHFSQFTKELKEQLVSSGEARGKQISEERQAVTVEDKKQPEVKKAAEKQTTWSCCVS
ncbi:unnamed protein product [Oreochromis niloticus]|nr:unnamed protein product [Mustela putorius furo]